MRCIAASVQLQGSPSVGAKVARRGSSCSRGFGRFLGAPNSPKQVLVICLGPQSRSYLGTWSLGDSIVKALGLWGFRAAGRRDVCKVPGVGGVQVCFAAVGS